MFESNRRNVRPLVWPTEITDYDLASTFSIRPFSSVKSPVGVRSERSTLLDSARSMREIAKLESPPLHAVLCIYAYTLSVYSLARYTPLCRHA